MSILARFQDRVLFPSFADLPTATPQPASDDDAPAEEERRWFLVGQIAENMTITQPTLILRDRDSSSFALTFEASIDIGGWKKGYTLVIENAKRTEGKEGKQGFVRIKKGDEVGVWCVPGPMDRVLVLGAGMGGDKGECSGCCGEGKRRCLGCGWVRYCGKVSCSPLVMGVLDADGSRSVRLRGG